VVSCTIVVVLATVFLMGGLTKPVLRLAGIDMGVSKQKVPLKNVSRYPLKNKLRWLDTNIIRPVLVSTVEPGAEHPSHASRPTLPPAAADSRARPICTPPAAVEGAGAPSPDSSASAEMQEL